MAKMNEIEKNKQQKTQTNKELMKEKASSLKK
jgi:hypothetical protein